MDQAQPEEWVISIRFGADDVGGDPHALFDRIADVIAEAYPGWSGVCGMRREIGKE